MNNDNTDIVRNEPETATTCLVIPSGVSEDIAALDNKYIRYKDFQDKIRQGISEDESSNIDVMEDIVSAIAHLSPTPTWKDIVTLGYVPLVRHFKMKKLRKVVTVLLHKIFDITLGWYALDYADLKQTCDYIGGRDYFSKYDHRDIYTAVIQKLQSGPIRDRCIDLRIIDFVSDKIVDIKDNFLKFKKDEL